MTLNVEFLKSLTEKYGSYVESFCDSDGKLPRMMDLKKTHTLHVVENAKAIAAGEGFDERTSLACEAAALLHDTGRYEQIRTYNTFRDSESVDHAKFSYDIVREKGWLDALDEKDAILDAVRVHNMRLIPQEVEGDLFASTIARVVRDADKLDIFRVLEDEIATIKGICDSGADGIRIYPTTVFASTELCEMMKIGIYSPLSVEEAVSRTAELLYIAHERKVPVIRVGLCETDSLHSENGIVAGAFHPALGEMCMSEFFFKLFSHTLDTCENLTDKNATIYVAPSMLSKAIGQKRININKLKEKYSFSDVKIKGSIALSDYEFSVDITD
jgi:HD superfamily phosphohydrolase YqeK